MYVYIYKYTHNTHASVHTHYTYIKIYIIITYRSWQVTLTCPQLTSWALGFSRSVSSQRTCEDPEFSGGKAVVHYVLTVLLAVFGWEKTTYIIIYIYNIIIIINNNDNNDNITYYNYTGTDFNYVQPAWAIVMPT